jgi:hypothetical protein
MMIFEPFLTGNILSIVLGGLILLWFFQLVFIWRRTNKRKALKSILQSILFSSLIFFLLQPSWENRQPGFKYMAVPETFAHADVNEVKDSLNIDFVGTISQLPKKHLEEIYILGQDYAFSELLSLPKSELHWIPYFTENQITSLTWDGVLNHGQLQEIQGRINTTNGTTVQLFEFGGLKQEVDISDADGYFEFQFPALILGQNELELRIHGEVAASIRFFVNPAATVTYQLLFGFPNPEGRVLTEYLVKRGDKAGISSQISKEGRITSGVIRTDQTPEVFILDRSQIKNKLITDAVGNGNTSLLILNLNDVEKDILAINQQFKTNFKIRKISEELRETPSGALAAPYMFEPESKTDIVEEGSISLTFVQGNKIAVSLLESTFQMSLAGDSVGYTEIWEKTLSAINPPPKEKIDLQMPIFSGLSSEINLLSQEADLKYIQIADDSLNLQKNPINEFKSKTPWIPESAGWKSLADTVAIYVYGADELSGLQKTAQMTAFLRDRRGDNLSEQVMDRYKIPDFVWFLIVLTSFTLVWIEPRFS